MLYEQTRRFPGPGDDDWQVWLTGYSSYTSSTDIDFWSNTCYNMRNEVQEVAKLYYTSCTEPMDLLILDWATLPCKLLVAWSNMFLFSPEDESVV